MFVCFQAGQAAGDAKVGCSSAATFDPRELHMQLEQQLSGQADTQPRSRRQLFNGQYARHTPDGVKQIITAELRKTILLELNNRERCHTKKEMFALQL